MGYKVIFLAVAVSAALGTLSGTAAQAQIVSGGVATSASASPSGAPGTAVSGTNSASPTYDATTGGGLALGSVQTNGTQRTGIVSGAAQIGHTAVPIGIAAVFSGASTIATANAFQTLHTFAGDTKGCFVTNPATNPAGTTLTVDWLGKTGTTPSTFTSTITLGQTVSCGFVPASGATISVTSNNAGAAVTGGVD